MGGAERESGYSCVCQCECKYLCSYMCMNYRYVQYHIGLYLCILVFKFGEGVGVRDGLGMEKSCRLGGGSLPVFWESSKGRPKALGPC